MFWNVSGGNGETDFLNYAQAGNGGYSFYTMKATITPHILASINSSGDVIPTGSIDITTGTGILTTAGLISNTVAGYLYGVSSSIQTQLNTLSSFTSNLLNTNLIWNAQQTFNYALNTSSTTLPSYNTNSIGYSYIQNNTSGINPIDNSSTHSSDTITVLSVGVYMIYSSIDLSITASSGYYAALSAQIFMNGTNQPNTKQHIYSKNLPPFSTLSLQPLPLCVNVSTVNTTFQCQYVLSSSSATIYNLNCVIQAVKIA